MLAHEGKPGVMSGSMAYQMDVSVAAGETSVARMPLPGSSARNTAFMVHCPNLLECAEDEPSGVVDETVGRATAECAWLVSVPPVSVLLGATMREAEKLTPRFRIITELPAQRRGDGA